MALGRTLNPRRTNTCPPDEHHRSPAWHPRGCGQAPGNEAALDLPCTNTLRTLSIDQVQQANSGHPGTPMGAAPTACALWQPFLRCDPAHPAWPDCDRFVLSVGHA